MCASPLTMRTRRRTRPRHHWWPRPGTPPPNLLLTVVFSLGLLCVCCGAAGNSPHHLYSTPGTVSMTEDCADPAVCSDPTGYRAISELHHQLDDDRDGQVDISESDEFLREELQYENGLDRQRGFHLDKKPITIRELWEAWRKSEVHNWTAQETANWLSESVELPQYAANFIDNAVDGSLLPRLASSTTYLNTLGIKDSIHRRKIALKATDIVLFGPPKDHSFVKDSILIALVFVLVGVGWFGYVQNRDTKRELYHVTRNMKHLQMAEDHLQSMQKELDRAKKLTENVTSQKMELEKQLRDKGAGKDDDASSRDGMDDANSSRVHQMELELKAYKDRLFQAQRQLDDNRWYPMPSLQAYLQLTYEIEVRYFNRKKADADGQLLAAKEACAKFSRKKSTLLGSFRLAHSTSIDDVDSRIFQAKSSLQELTQDLKERTNRWKQIEQLCSFPIIDNPGIKQLEIALGIRQDGMMHHQIPHNGSVDDIDEDYDAVSFTSNVNAVQQLVHTSATVFLAPVPPSYTAATMYNEVPTRVSPPKRPQLLHHNSGGSLYDHHHPASHTSTPTGVTPTGATPLSSPTVGSTTSLGNHTLASNLHQSRSSGWDDSESGSQAVIRNSHSDNSLSTSTSSLSDSNKIPGQGHVGTGGAVNQRTIFIVGSGNTERSSPDCEEPKPQRPASVALSSIAGVSGDKSLVWKNQKSFSQDQSTPPREIIPTFYSESVLNSRNVAAVKAAAASGKPGTVNAAPTFAGSAAPHQHMEKNGKNSINAATLQQQQQQQQQQPKKGLSMKGVATCVQVATSGSGGSGTSTPPMVVPEEKSDSSSASPIEEEIKPEKPKKKKLFKFGKLKRN